MSRRSRHRAEGRLAVLLALAVLVAGLAVLERSSRAVASTPAALGRIAYGGTLNRSIGVIDPASTTTSAPLFPGGPQHYDDEPSARGDAVVWTSLRASLQPQVFLQQGDGAPVQITKGLTGVQYPVLSPDRRRIAFAATTGRTDGGHDLWVVNTDGTGLRRVTDAEGDSTWPTWDPSGTRIGFSATRDGDPCRQIYAIDASGGTPRKLTDTRPSGCEDGTARNIEPAWDPVDSHRRLLFTTVRLTDEPQAPPIRQIRVLRLTEGGETDPVPLLWRAMVGRARLVPQQVRPTRRFGRACSTARPSSGLPSRRPCRERMQPPHRAGPRLPGERGRRSNEPSPRAARSPPRVGPRTRRDPSSSRQRN